MTRTFEDGMTEVGYAQRWNRLGPVLGILLAACGTKSEPGSPEVSKPETNPSTNAKPQPAPLTQRSNVAVEAGDAWIYRSSCGMAFDDLTTEKLAMKQAVAAYRIDADTVSCDEWKPCIEAGACEGLDTGQMATARICLNGKALVGWDAARRFCEWHGARLPTSAEWIRAAHGAEKFPNARLTPGRCGEKQFPEQSTPTFPCKSSAGMLFNLATIGNEWTNDEGCDVKGLQKHVTISTRDVFTVNRPVDDNAWFRCAR
jgi:Sulfatase-modifying factor enzyme 1